MAPIAETPEPPYYVVVITTQRTPVDDGYGDMAARMFELASRQPGYLGMESVRAADGAGITSSYWADLDSIARWKAHVDHLVAQRTGQARWYESYQVRVGRIERDYRWSRPAAGAAPAEPPGPSAIR
jgi:heme-degrading monooxygenase HmoA